MEVGEAALEDILFRHSSGFVFFVPNSLMFLLVAHHQKGNPGGRKWISKQKKLEEEEAAEEEEIRRKICTGIRFGLHFGSIGKLGVEQPRGGVTPVY